MNQEVLYLVGIFFIGCLAIMFRAISFNLAGERFVARLRTKVILLLQCLCNNVISISSFHCLALRCNYQSRNWFL